MVPIASIAPGRGNPRRAFPFVERGHVTDSKAKRRAHDRERAARQPWRRLYNTKEWKAAKAAQQAKMPWCERCWAAGVRTPMKVVNHRIPHKGDERLFFDPANHESACQPHHDRVIQREERVPVYASEEEARRAYLARRSNLLKVKGFSPPAKG